MITGMSLGRPVPTNAKVALARGANMVGSSNTTGDGGMLKAEREESKALVYEVLPSAGTESTCMTCGSPTASNSLSGQGAKPGTGGLLLGRQGAWGRGVATGPAHRRRPAESGAAPGFPGPDDMIIKIEELPRGHGLAGFRFSSRWAPRAYSTTFAWRPKRVPTWLWSTAWKAETGASAEICQEHTGIPTLAAVCEARAALEDIGMYGKVQLIIAGGIRNGVDAAKAMALGADAVYIGTAALMALNCNRPVFH